jgi:hypothetical protein
MLNAQLIAVVFGFPTIVIVLFFNWIGFFNLTDLLSIDDL